MIITGTNLKGMDVCFSLLQSWLSTELFAVWNRAAAVVSDDKFIFYPRADRRPTPKPGTGFIAEVLTGDGNYKEVYWDDNLTGLSFFGIGPKIEAFGIESTVDVHLVVFANVKKLYPTLDHRADNEIRLDFQKIFEAPLLGFTLVNTEIWLANVLKEYPGSRRDDRLTAADMGDVHAFRLNLKLVFNPDQLC